jgi:hypothetical protein
VSEPKYSLEADGDLLYIVTRDTGAEHPRAVALIQGHGAEGSMEEARALLAGLMEDHAITWVLLGRAKALASFIRVNRMVPGCPLYRVEESPEAQKALMDFERTCFAMFGDRSAEENPNA